MTQWRNVPVVSVVRDVSFILEDEVIPCFVARDLGNLPPITFNAIDVSVLLAKIESMHDEVQLMRAGMTCQQTTAETLKKVCEETVFRMDVLESKTTQHVNNISEGCQMTVDLHLYIPWHRLLTVRMLQFL